jgi:hypothetical protein
MDYYMENPARLEGQPKRVNGDYAETNGILVPGRFGSLAEARKSGLPIIARSEHPQDYAGCSGLVESPKLQDGKYANMQSEEELKATVLAEPSHGVLHQFCRLSGYDMDKFKQETSFSFWELIDGIRRVVVADSSIPSRHHVITYKQHAECSSYAIVENNNVVKEFVAPLDPELAGGLPSLLETYESVRHLGRFDPNHCPIVEALTSMKNPRVNYFLQYHRGRNFEPVQFVLERPPNPGEREVPFVRGATGESGMRCKVTVYYDFKKSIWALFDPNGEDGSWDNHYCVPFSELMVRGRKLQMKDIKPDLTWELHRHVGISKLFKPQVSAIDYMSNYFLPGESLDSFSDMAHGQNSCMWLDVVSDGRRAFVRRTE